MARVMALDVGKVRIGVALSCPMGVIAQPLEVIDRRRADGLARIVELVAGYGVQAIVVGRPLTLAGEAGLAVQTTEAFVGALCQRVDLPVHWWDERLTTAAAERAMIGGGARRQERRMQIDKVAAALILQAYLDAPPQAAESSA